MNLTIMVNQLGLNCPQPNWPIEVPIQFYAGETFAPMITVTDQNAVPLNLTNYMVQMMARVTPTAIDPPFILLTTNNGGITVNGTQGQIFPTVTATVSGTLALYSGYWDIFIFSPGGAATRIAGGQINIPEPVTRP